MSKFVSQICRLCGICSVTEPYFCSSMCNVSKSMFAKILKHTVALKYHDKEKFSELRSFHAMVGRYCNNPQVCKFRTVECEFLDYPIKCYEMFINQSGLLLSLEGKSDIYAAYSGINLRSVGREFAIPKKPFKGVSKKSSKRINKAVEKAIHSVGKESEKTLKKHYKKNNKNKYKVESKPITTTFFCSDNEEWQGKIDKILGANNQTNEANNRQPAHAVKYSNGYKELVH
jgi:hypothetical protein